MSVLKKLNIVGLKSIHTLYNFELSSLNILIGSNGAGKSNFLQLFRLLHEIGLRNLQRYVSLQGGAKTFVYDGPNSPQSIDFNLSFSDFHYGAGLVSNRDDVFTFTNERCAFLENEIVAMPQGLFYESALHNIRQGKEVEIAEQILQNLENLRLYHFYDPKPISQTSDVGDNLFLRHDGSNIASVLYLMRLKQRQYYDRIIETIRMVAPFFDDFNLRPNRENPEKIKLEWREKGTDGYRSGYLLSDGTLRFICLATLLRQSNPPSLILIDEPELGLHPYAIVLLAAMIKAASVDTQVIISTQSPTLVNHFEPKDIIVVDKKNQESTFSRLNTTELQDWLEDYTLSELWEKNVIGGRP